MREQQAAQESADAQNVQASVSAAAESTPASSEQAVPSGEVTGETQAQTTASEGTGATSSIGETPAAAEAEGQKNTSA